MRYSDEEKMIKTKDDALRERAHKILGLEDDASYDQVKHAANCKLFKHHPDRNHDKDAEDIAMLVIEAYNLLRGRSHSTSCLEDDYLVEMAITNPVTPIDEFSYESWLKDKFYGEDGLIWPDLEKRTQKKSAQPKRKRLGHNISYSEYAEERGFFDFIKPD